MVTAAVEISTGRMTVEQVVAVAGGAPVALGEDAIRLLQTSREIVDEAIGQGAVIYGVTTGVGHARDERLPVDGLRQQQPMLLEMHVGGMGPALPRERVRAGMVARLSGFARGGAGVSLPVARRFAELLNHGIHPLVPSRGSVGSGDLGQLAIVGRALLGRGQVEVDGRARDAAEALEAAGLEPVQLEPKDALAIISSNALSVGHAALLSERIGRLLTLADLLAATSMEAVIANPSITDPAVATARGSRGQQVTSEHMRRALRGSTRTTAGTARSVQDALSFRVVPQVHGACRDVLSAAVEVVTNELNAAADNPLVDVVGCRIVSNGNFQALDVALAAESLRVALGHVGLLAERRMGHLWDAAVTSMGAAGPPPGVGSPAALAGLGLRYPAAATYTRLRQLAAPVTLDVPSLDLAVEDHAPTPAEALRATEDAVDLVEELLVTELLIAAVLLAPAVGSERLGNGTGRLLGVVTDAVDQVPDGALPHDVHARVTEALRRALPDLADG